MTDTELMTLIQANDMDAFEVFYTRHFNVSLSVAMRILRDRQLAEDATQEAFVAFWGARAKFRSDRAPVKTWLLVIVGHRAIDVLRRLRARPTAWATTEDLGRQIAPDCTEAQALAAEELRQIDAQLQKLPEPQRQVIELAYFGGLSHTEIAQRLNLPLGTTKGRIRSGRSKLRTAFTE